MNLIKVQRSIVMIKQALLAAVLLLPAAMYGTTYTVGNSSIAVSIASEDGRMTVSNKTTHTVWTQEVFQTYWSLANVTVTGGNTIAGEVRKYGSYYMNFTIQLLSSPKEFDVSLWDVNNTTYPGQTWIPFPHPFVGSTNASLVVPHSMGLCVPVTSKDIWYTGNPTYEVRNQLEFFSGHAMSMNWYGVVNSGSGEGLQTLVLTPCDAVFGVVEGSVSDRLGGMVKWLDDMRKLGSRSLRFVVQNSGGYKQMCDRYRQYALNSGLIKTLDSKVTDNPTVGRIKNAALYWPMGPGANLLTGDDLVSMASSMKTNLGIDKMVFYQNNSYAAYSAAQLAAITNLGYLPSRYIIFNSFVKQEERPFYSGYARDVPNSEGLLDSNGNYVDLWPFIGTNGQTYYTKYWSDRYRTAWIPVDKALDTDAGVNFQSWFVDTAFAHGWTQDYSPAHLMSRTECMQERVNFMSNVVSFGTAQAGMVAGVEAGIAEGVRMSHWFEGKMTTQPFNFSADGVTDFSTYDATRIFGNEAIIKRSHEFQVPLWQLVFGNCVKTSYRWEGANNKAPHDFWWKRNDLYCALYGEMQMFVFLEAWYSNSTNQSLLSDSYNRVRRASQEVGFSRMINHEYLTADKAVQRTTFDNGTVITANFGTAPYQYDADTSIPQYEFHVTLNTNAGVYTVENKAYAFERLRVNTTGIDLTAPPTGVTAQWQLVNAGSGYYFIESQPNAHARLRASGLSYINLADAQTTTDSVRWKLRSVGNGYYLIENKAYAQTGQPACLSSTDGGSGFLLVNQSAASTNAMWRLMRQL